MTGDLKSARCVPCEGGVAKLEVKAIERLRLQVPDWDVADGERLRRQFRFGDFRELMAFVNLVAELAESEGHHPDFRVHYNVLDVEIWTHAIGGLSENDFILAAKIDGLLPSR